MNDSKSLSVFEDQGLSTEQARVCTLIASGQSIEKACKLATITEYRYAKWIAELPAFEQAVRRARAILLERRVDQMADVARTEPDVQRARLIIDTDKWLASKLISAVYGDKLEVAIDHRISVADALTAARARATVRLSCDSADVIDAEFEAAPSVAGVRIPDNESSAPGETAAPALPDIFS